MLGQSKSLLEVRSSKRTEREVTRDDIENVTEPNIFTSVFAQEGVLFQLIFSSPVTYKSLWQTWSLEKRMSHLNFLN